MGVSEFNCGSCCPVKKKVLTHMEEVFELLLTS